MQGPDEHAFETQIEGRSMAPTARYWRILAAAVVCASTPRAMAEYLTEIERARENLIQSGKPFGGSSRRDSMPMMGGPRPYSDYGNLPYTPTLN